MRRRRFLIPTLFAAGFGHHGDAAADVPRTPAAGGGDPDSGGLLRLFSQEHYVTLADHRSHSSHSSHASHGSGYGGGGHYSHTSHRSSAGGGYDPAPLHSSPAPYVPATPAPSPTPTPWSAPSVEPFAPLPATAQPLFGADDRAAPPPADRLPALSGRTARFKSIVRRVQLALLARGIYAGAIDGTVGPSLRSALRRFQKDLGLEATGTITPQTLDALMVSSQ